MTLRKDAAAVEDHSNFRKRYNLDNFSPLANKRAKDIMIEKPQTNEITQSSYIRPEPESLPTVFNFLHSAQLQQQKPKQTQHISQSLMGKNINIQSPDMTFGNVMSNDSKQQQLPLDQPFTDFTQTFASTNNNHSNANNIQKKNNSKKMSKTKIILLIFLILLILCGIACAAFLLLKRMFPSLHVMHVCTFIYNIQVKKHLYLLIFCKYR